MNQVILIAEEHEATRRFLADNLTADGYDVWEAADRATAEAALLGPHHVDAMIVDVNGQTLGLLDAVRLTDSRLSDQLPVLVLTANPDTVHRVRLLERGSDDVLTKPFSYPELRARLANLIARCSTERVGRKLIRVGPLTLDVHRIRVTVAGVDVMLRGKEWALLLALAGEPARVFTREELMRDVWGWVAVQRSRTLDSTCARLRAKLAVGEYRFIENVWGVGYRLVSSAQLEAWQRAA